MSELLHAWWLSDLYKAGAEALSQPVRAPQASSGITVWGYGVHGPGAHK